MSQSPSVSPTPVAQARTSITKNPDFGVSLNVAHTCGHRSGYFFAAEEFASLQSERYSTSACLFCENKRRLAA